MRQTKNNAISSGKCQPNAPHLSRQKETKVATIAVEKIDAALPLGSVQNIAVDSKILKVVSLQCAFDDVEHALALAEDQHARLFFEQKS